MYPVFAHLIRRYSIIGNKTQLSRNIYETDSIRWYNHLRHTAKEIWQQWEKVDASDLMMSYTYIHSITKTWTGQFTT